MSATEKIWLPLMVVMLTIAVMIALVVVHLALADLEQRPVKCIQAEQQREIAAMQFELQDQRKQDQALRDQVNRLPGNRP